MVGSNIHQSNDFLLAMRQENGKFFKLGVAVAKHSLKAATAAEYFQPMLGSNQRFIRKV